MATAWNKLKTLMRGQARVSMEQIVNANDMLLLDQQLYETEQSLRDARRQLARLPAVPPISVARDLAWTVMMKRRPGYWTEMNMASA